MTSASTLQLKGKRKEKTLQLGPCSRLILSNTPYCNPGGSRRPAAKEYWPASKVSGVIGAASVSSSRLDARAPTLLEPPGENETHREHASVILLYMAISRDKGEHSRYWAAQAIPGSRLALLLGLRSGVKMMHLQGSQRRLGCHYSQLGS